MGTADFTHRIEVNGPQDLRYIGQRLEWLRSRLSDLEEQQNRFLRHVSHELKTPLTAVREGVELLRDNVGGKLAAEQREIVRIVRENTLSLQKLIEDLLTYHQTRAMEPQTLGPRAAARCIAPRRQGAQARGARANDLVRSEIETGAGRRRR
jgi:two-component system sensor histidine kinase GlrK